MFNIIKCYKVKKTHLTKVSNHTHRTNLTEAEKNRINTNLTEKNIVLHGNNASLDIRSRIKAYCQKTRKDAVYAEQYIISASPEFFNEKNLDEWVELQIEFLKNEFGSNFTTAVLHLDETTPHIEAFVTPICKNKSNKTILSRKTFNEQRGGLKSFKMLQDRHFEHNKRLGLKRGISKEITNLTYNELNDYYKEAKEYSKAFLNYQPPKIDDLMPEKNWGVYKHEDIKKALRKALEINSKVFKKALNAVQYYKKLYLKIIKELNITIYEKNRLKENLEELEDENKRIIAENKGMIKSYNKLAKIANETAPVAELGRKAIDLDMTEEIEEKYELKHTPKPENKKQNKLK